MVFFHVFGLICGNLGGIFGNGDLKIDVFWGFCQDFCIFCGKLKKITIFEGKLTAEKRGIVGFWSLNGVFLFFAVDFGLFFCFRLGFLEFWC